MPAISPMCSSTPCWARILSHLGRKEQPFRVIDTHAGAGTSYYDLQADEAMRTGGMA